MKLLKDRILESGIALDNEVLLVDSFLNNQVDVKLMHEIGREFARLFKDAGITRVMTIESSGIAPAVYTADEMNLPLVIMKKSASRILNQDTLQTEVFSFTKNSSYMLTMKKKFVFPGDRVLLIDDFMANGQASQGAIRLVEAAGATMAGIGIVIAKAFQPGLNKLRSSGYNVQVLAPVSYMNANHIEFEEE